jgi:flavodoxin
MNYHHRRLCMKYAVRYQSRDGNARAVAEIIAGILGVKAEPVDRPMSAKAPVTCRRR